MLKNIFSKKVYRYLIPFLLILATYFFIYRPLQIEIKSLKVKTDKRQLFLVESRNYYEELPRIEREYKKILNMEKDIIGQVHSNIKKNNLELLSIYYNSVGSDFRVTVETRSSFKEFTEFCKQLINSLSYRPHVISISLLSKERDDLITNMKLNFE